MKKQLPSKSRLFPESLPAAVDTGKQETLDGKLQNQNKEIGTAKEVQAANKKLTKASENALLLSTIVNSSKDAIISKTLEGIITSWNKGAENIFGFKATEAIGKPIAILIPKELYHEEEKIIK
jgi:PAS domain-containing protein